MKHTLLTIKIIALLTVSLLAVPLADAQENKDGQIAGTRPERATVKVTQQLLNSIHVTPKLIFDPFPAYAEKYLPFAMAASIEVTRGGRV